MKYIRFFKDIFRQEVGEFGGKTASLGELYQAGIPVPNGFGISIQAHREFAGKPFSRAFKAELERAFKRLRSDRVAVRSSAVAEDAADASWAGQLESYLNVEAGDLEASIRKCWESIQSERAQSYAKGRHFANDSLLVGVAVQLMIEADAAGVMFTAHPVTGNRDETVIEAAYGLGEMVVQGAVTPDNFIVGNKQLTVTQFAIQVKERMMVFKNGINRIVPVPEAIANRAVLREPQVLELARIGQKIALHYGSPQDIEWCIKDKTFFIVQARPITTL